LGKRLIRWFFLNFIFAFTPLAVGLVAQSLIGQLTINDLQNNLSEILFFSIMICVTSISDLDDIIKAASEDMLMTGIRQLFIFGAVWSSVLYAFFVFYSSSGLNVPEFKIRLTYYAVPIAVTVFAVGLSTQVLIARIIEQTKTTNVTRKRP
jgi:hypothetical protein